MLLTSEHVHNKSKFKGIKRHRPNFHSSPSALQVSSSDDTTLTNFFCNLLEMSSAHKAYIGSSFSPFTYGAFVFKKNTYLAGPDLSCGSISAICCSTWDLLVAACGMSFPDWRLNAGSLHWECGVSAPGPPGKSLHTLHSIHSGAPCLLQFISEVNPILAHIGLSLAAKSKCFIFSQPTHP